MKAIGDDCIEIVHKYLHNLRMIDINNEIKCLRTNKIFDVYHKIRDTQDSGVFTDPWSCRTIQLDRLCVYIKRPVASPTFRTVWIEHAGYTQIMCRHHNLYILDDIGLIDWLFVNIDLF